MSYILIMGFLTSMLMRDTLILLKIDMSWPLTQVYLNYKVNVFS